MSDEKRVALVTGGAHRVGGAISTTLAAAGMDVAVHYRSSAGAAEETVAAIAVIGRRAFAVAADVADPAAVDAMVTRVADELGPVAVLVNSASHFARDEFPTDDLSVWRTTMEVVLDGLPGLGRSLFLLHRLLGRSRLHRFGRHRHRRFAGSGFV